MTTVSTHVLDSVTGTPATGLDIVLTDSTGVFIEAATTDVDGRVHWGLDLDPGHHTLTLATGEWFAAADRPTFYPVVTLTVALTGEHVHVALLLGPYSYTTYQGS